MAITHLAPRNVTSTTAGFTLTTNSPGSEVSVIIVSEGLEPSASTIYSGGPSGDTWAEWYLDDSGPGGTFTEEDFDETDPPFLQPGVKYNLCAVDDAGEGIPVYIEFQTEPSVVIPVLSSPAAISITHNSFTARVATDVGDGEIVATLYLLSDLDDPIASLPHEVVQDGEQTWGTPFSGLEPGTAYRVVYVHTDSNDGVSDPVFYDFETDEAPLNPVTGLTLDSLSPSSLIVSFTLNDEQGADGFAAVLLPYDPEGITNRPSGAQIANGTDGSGGMDVEGYSDALIGIDHGQIEVGGAQYPWLDQQGETPVELALAGDYTVAVVALDFIAAAVGDPAYLDVSTSASAPVLSRPSGVGITHDTAVGRVLCGVLDLSRGTTPIYTEDPTWDGALYMVLIPRPASSQDYPESTHIRAGTDKFGQPAHDAQAIIPQETSVWISSAEMSVPTQTFPPSTGLTPDTDYLFAYAQRANGADSEPHYYPFRTLRAPLAPIDVQSGEGPGRVEFDPVVGLIAGETYRVAMLHEGDAQAIVIDVAIYVHSPAWLPSATGGTPTVESAVAMGRVAFVVSEDELSDEDVIVAVEAESMSEPPDTIDVQVHDITQTGTQTGDHITLPEGVETAYLRAAYIDGEGAVSVLPGSVEAERVTEMPVDVSGVESASVTISPPGTEAAGVGVRGVESASVTASDPGVVVAGHAVAGVEAVSQSVAMPGQADAGQTVPVTVTGIESSSQTVAEPGIASAGVGVEGIESASQTTADPGTAVAGESIPVNVSGVEAASRTIAEPGTATAGQSLTGAQSVSESIARPGTAVAGVAGAVIVEGVESASATEAPLGQAVAGVNLLGAESASGTIAVPGLVISGNEIPATETGVNSRSETLSPSGGVSAGVRVSGIESRCGTVAEPGSVVNGQLVMGAESASETVARPGIVFTGLTLVRPINNPGIERLGIDYAIEKIGGN